MTAQVATLELSYALAVELHALFRALDLRVRTPELIRDRLAAAGRCLDAVIEADWSLMPAIAESLERVAELLRHYQQHPIFDDRTTWRELKAQLREVYDGFALALRTEDVKVPELRPTNYVRSGFHVLSGAVCLVLCVALTPEQLPWVAGAFAAWSWSMETLRRISPWANDKMMALFRPIAHEQERHRVNSATWYMTALVLLALTYSPLICAVGVAVLGLADPVAGLVGRRWGRRKLVNNRTLEGTLTFVATGTVAAGGAMLLVEPSLPAAAHWLTALAAATTGGLAELYSHRVDDNLAIPITSATTAAVVLTLLGLSAWP